MSLPDIRPQANLLSEFVLATLGALGLGFPDCDRAHLDLLLIPASFDAAQRANGSPALAVIDKRRLTSTRHASGRSECGQIFGHL